MEAQKQILIVIFLCIHIVRSTRTRLTRNIQCCVVRLYIYLSLSYFRNETIFISFQRNHFHGKLIPTKIIFPFQARIASVQVSSALSIAVDGTLALDQIYIQIQMHYMYRLLWPISHLIHSLECFRNVLCTCVCVAAHAVIVSRIQNNKLGLVRSANAGIVYHWNWNIYYSATVVPSYECQAYHWNIKILLLLLSWSTTRCHWIFNFQCVSCVCVWLPFCVVNASGRCFDTVFCATK